MTIPANSPYRSSNFIKNPQHESLIRHTMSHPHDPIDITNPPQLPPRKRITVIFQRILHKLKMVFNRSGYRTPFIKAAIQIEAARSEKQKALAALINPPQKPAEKVDIANAQPLSDGKITTGQGEYILFHQLENGEMRKPSPEIFEKAYQLLLEHKPRTLAQQSMEACENRHALLNQALKRVDPSLQAVFVPKTLYELVFIRKIIGEDLKHNSICKRLSHLRNEEALEKADEVTRQQLISAQAADIAKRKCWHICFFKDEGDDQHEDLKKMAFRMNKVLLKTLKPSADGFTFKDIQEFGENELTFLKTFYKETQEKRARGERVVSDNYDGGPTTNFAQNLPYGGTTPMAISDENVAQIVRNALILDCSEHAKNSLFIFRGSKFYDDCITRNMKPYSLSYGTSLFAGCIFDGSATALYYMRSDFVDSAHAMSIPFDQVDSSPFFVPQTHTLAQLYGYGEIFHARTKAWADAQLTDIGGYQGFGEYSRDHLASNLSKEALEAAYKTYKAQAIQLRP